MTKQVEPTTRRKFLKHAGLAAAALPLFNILKYGRAGAATTTAPLRLLNLWSPFQAPEIFYHPQATSGSGFAAAGSSFNLSFTNSILAPLAPYQKQLLVFRGLCYGDGPNSHESSPSAFSGYASNTSGSEAATSGSTIDQYLFSRMGAKGSLGPITAGLLSYLYADHLYDSTISWSNGTAQGMLGNPADVLKTYFGNFTPPSSGGSGGPTPAQAAVLARRQKSLSIAQNGLKAMSGQLSSASPSQSKLQSHQTALAGLISSLSGSGTTVSLASCTVPTSSTVNNDPSGAGNYKDVTQDMTSFSTLITEAFACDITRFASIKMSGSDDPGTEVVPFIPGLTSFSGNFHGDVSHTETDKTSNASDTKMAIYKNYWMQLAAQILKQLQSTADPYSPSQSLFDNTVVMINSEGPIQTPSGDLHNNGNCDQPIIVTGGCGGLFNMGRIVDVRSMGKVVSASGIPMNALLTNIVNAFENNQKAFNPAYTPKILTQYGSYSFPVNASTWLST